MNTGRKISPAAVHEAYAATGNLNAMARVLGVSYPTAQAWANAVGVTLKRQGYTPPVLSVTGLQCRHAREFIGMTRDKLCAEAKISKTALMNFELGKAMIRRSTLMKLQATFDRHRIVFMSDGTFRADGICRKR